jgi:hypothetical protein
MGHRSNTDDAAVKDAQTLLKKEECAGRMGQNACEKSIHFLSDSQGDLNQVEGLSYGFLRGWF